MECTISDEKDTDTLDVKSLPAINLTGSMTTTTQELPSYVTRSRPSSARANTVQNVNQEGGSEKANSAANQSETDDRVGLASLQLSRPANHSAFQPKAFSISAENIESRLAEISLAFDRLKSVGFDELVENSEAYTTDCSKIRFSMLRANSTIKANRQRTLALLLEKGVIQFIKQYWSRIVQGIADSERWAQGNGLLTAANNYVSVYVVIYNGSDIAEKVILEKLFEDISEFLIDQLQSPVLKEAPYKPNTVIGFILKGILGTLHNFLQSLGNSQYELEKLNATEYVSHYITCSDLMICGKCMLVLAYLLKENENSDLIKASDETIKHLIHMLRSSLESDHFYSSKYGYRSVELLDGLNRMAALDSNKRLLVQHGALPLYVKAMSENASVKSQTLAAKGIWTLCFDEASKQKAKSETGCLESLKRLLDSDVDDVKQAANGALWKLEREQQYLSATRLTNIASDEGKKHIMISYNWGVQNEVFKLRDRLRQEGFTIWIDIEQMSGSTLEAMGIAVEQAAVVLICYTEKYKYSPPCRSEAEYAYKLNKPVIMVRMQPKYVADGWLGMLLGTKLFYDLTRPEKYESTVKQLLSILRDSFRDPSNQDDGNILPSKMDKLEGQKSLTADNYDQTDGSTRTSSVYAIYELKCYKWNAQEVNQWLADNDLANTSIVNALDGSLLAELIGIYITAPEAYYSIMREDLKFTALDVLKINRALRKLLP